MRYLFGDSDLAAHRLGLVAATFAAPSERFLRQVAQHVDVPPAVALDLGCGPGHTTRLVARTTGARRTVGIDSSPAFLAMARANHPDLDFVEHDVAALPLPFAPAGLVYCRLLLAHLPDPAAQTGAWLTQVAPGGALALDEIEWIRSDHPVLQRYEELLVVTAAARDARMYAGPHLDSVDPGPPWERVSTLVTFPVATATAARMFAWNLRVWRTDPAVDRHISARDLDRLQRDLDDLQDAPGDSSAITWGLRQLLFVRHDARNP